jgi:hypothetical protein
MTSFLPIVYSISVLNLLHLKILSYESSLSLVDCASLAFSKFFNSMQAKRKGVVTEVLFLLWV